MIQEIRKKKKNEKRFVRLSHQLKAQVTYNNNITSSFEERFVTHFTHPHKCLHQQFNTFFIYTPSRQCLHSSPAISDSTYLIDSFISSLTGIS
ncbi:hypothetical protein QVD17_15356 [Tagetes erecta]|uniref:Uncharacterized protein n=1 Tax=Tagetes erecta TaxID=13708 RepID=A0AAD8NZL7_TARER|nr:hypothetical protein QVD17_15356 [Tagetes erecta]